MNLSDSRRKFIKASSLCLSAIGLGSLTAFAKDEKPTMLNADMSKKTDFLWPDNSVNNGSDPKKRPKLEFFIPKTSGDQKRAAIIVCPGGSYSGLAAHEGAPFAELFAAHGIVGVVLTYRVAPNRYPAAMADAFRAMRMLRAQAVELNLDPAKIGILGFSAGGHLVSTVATQPNLYKDPQDDLSGKFSARPDRVMMGYPVISFEEFAHGGSVKNLLGDAPSPDMLRQLSNQKQVTGDNPPAFLFHTADDAVVPVQNSLYFAEACVRNKVPVALHVYPHGPHGVGMAAANTELNGWSEILMKWLADWQSPLA